MIFFPAIGLKSNVDGLNVTNATWPPRDVFMTQTSTTKTRGYTLQFRAYVGGEF